MGTPAHQRNLPNPLRPAVHGQHHPQHMHPAFQQQQDHIPIHPRNTDHYSFTLPTGVVAQGSTSISSSQPLITSIHPTSQHSSTNPQSPGINPERTFSDPGQMNLSNFPGNPIPTVERVDFMPQPRFPHPREHQRLPSTVQRQPAFPHGLNSTSPPQIASMFGNVSMNLAIREPDATFEQPINWNPSNPAHSATNFMLQGPESQLSHSFQPQNFMTTSTHDQLYRAQSSNNLPSWGMMNSVANGSPNMASRGNFTPAASNPVVGRQGTRGPLPVENGTAPLHDNDIEPEQRPDGKWSCPSCEAAFSFPKHVKRHYMRHTGERPYSCICCHTTFARSDVLKRHYAKCSDRTPGFREIPIEQRMDHLQGRRGKPNKTSTKNKTRARSKKETPGSSSKGSSPEIGMQ